MRKQVGIISANNFTRLEEFQWLSFAPSEKVKVQPVLYSRKCKGQNVKFEKPGFFTYFQFVSCKFHLSV